jgi:hypothetical protein
MKKIIFLVSLMLACTAGAIAQSANDFMISGALDLIKTDNQEMFDKAQIGIEANYFVIRKFTATAGLEIWTFNNESFVIGSRWYPTDNLFVRFRGLIGENDFSTGIGGAFPLKPNLRFELIGDFYFRGEFAVRTGVSFILPSK